MTHKEFDKDIKPLERICMKKIKSLSVFLAFASTLLTWNSDSVAFSLKTEKSTETFEEITLLKNSTINFDKTPLTLNRVSYGLRKKAVFGLVPVRVYTLELLAAKPEQIKKTDDGILKSLKEAGPIQLEINFLRDLPGSKVSEAFKEGLEANKINVKKLSVELQQVLKEISEISEFKKHSSFSVVISWEQSQATVYLQQPEHEVKSVTGPSEFAEQFLSIWFGQPADRKLGDLKKDLIK